MSWVEHAIFWHTYPLGLGGAPIRDAPTPGHRLRAVIDRLDHVVELGANAVLLDPVFASASHGYDTVDHFRIDDRLGTDQDFDDLVLACRERGVRLVLDGVFSHVAVGHPAVPALQARTEDGAVAVFEGHDSLLRLDHARPETAALVLEIMDHWCARGIDGWRLDAAYSVDPGFWAGIMPRLRERHPDVWVVGEVLHGDYAEFVSSSGIDSVTQYELWKAIRSSIAEKNLFELDWTLQRHNGFLETFLPQTFVGNHDVTRIATAVGVPGSVAATAVLMVLGGVPSIYYGDELGLTGLKEERLGGDDAVRPGWPTDLTPEMVRMIAVHRELIGVRRRHPWLLRARTESLQLSNTRVVLRSVAHDGSAQLDLELDLAAEARVVIRGADGVALWSSSDQH